MSTTNPDNIRTPIAARLQTMGLFDHEAVAPLEPQVTIIEESNASSMLTFVLLIGLIGAILAFTHLTQPDWLNNLQQTKTAGTELFQSALTRSKIFIEQWTSKSLPQPLPNEAQAAIQTKEISPKPLEQPISTPVPPPPTPPQAILAKQTTLMPAATQPKPTAITPPAPATTTPIVKSEPKLTLPVVQSTPTPVIKKFAPKVVPATKQAIAPPTTQQAALPSTQKQPSKVARPTYPQYYYPAPAYYYASPPHYGYQQPYYYQQQPPVQRK